MTVERNPRGDGRSVLYPVLRRIFEHSFFRFVIVGGTGFVVDAIVLSALVKLAGVDPLLARAVSFSTALFCTWAFNRGWSFAATRSARVLPEAGRYVAVQLTGGAANLAVYAAMVRMIPGLHGDVLLPLAAGSAVGIGINYLGSRFLVFRGDREAA